MLNLIAVQYSQSHCYTHTVIGTKRGATGLEPAVLHVSLYRLSHEIVFQSGILLTHHILMCLQDYCLPAIVTGSGRLGNQHVSYIILTTSQPTGGCKVHQIITHFLLTTRGTRNPAYL